MIHNKNKALIEATATLLKTARDEIDTARKRLYTMEIAALDLHQAARIYKALGDIHGGTMAIDDVVRELQGELRLEEKGKI